MGDDLDHSTGFEMLVRLGDSVERGEPIVRLFAQPDMAPPITTMLRQAITIGTAQLEANPLILERID